MASCRLCILLVLSFLSDASGHGSMISPAPRSAHNQVFDQRNKCGCENTASGCYSKAGSEGEYCGLGCIGESCLYYQIGCFQNCPTCSYMGKTLYPVPQDLVAAGNCPTPPAPTLGGGDAAKEHQLRTYNIDGASKLGDWTKWNPWRSPGTAGKGNPAFQPCGVNSGSNPSFPDPPAAGQPQFANGTALPETPRTARSTWTRGSVVDAAWAIYANHGGGYSYRLCKRVPGVAEAEECYQRLPLDFATETTTIHYHDGGRSDILINATTTSEGTWPQGSQWRKNPIPMCNCDIGEDCNQVGGQEQQADVGHAVQHLASSGSGGGGKKCVAVSDEAQCGKTLGKNTCLKCGDASSYDCEECCPELTRVNKTIGGAEYSWCVDPNTPTAKCDPVSNKRACYGEPYPKTYVPAGSTAKRCPTGLMFPAQWDDGHSGFVGGPGYSMIDKLRVPDDIPPGDYSLSWRWDCEQTPQVWNSCADITIV